MTGRPGFPRRFDSYVLLKPLARGGMGQLYLALSGAAGLEKLCVIKKLLPDLIAPENARRFRDEAKVALRLTHGNLVTVFDAGTIGDEIYLAMELVEGKDLLATWNRCAQKRVPFPVDIAVYIVKEVTRALAYAHTFEDLKLVHRDVSPANVLLSYTGEVKLTDFGLAMSILKIERTTPGIIYGKISYLSPEQARRLTIDGRADIFSAGILLWELLTGRQLFPAPGSGDKRADDGSQDTLSRARNPEVVPPSRLTSRVPPALDRIVMRALASEREDRYQSAEALRADLASFLAEIAPETDAARLSSFLQPLFADDARKERKEREELVVAAARLLSGAIVDSAGPAGGAGAAAASAAPVINLASPHTPPGHHIDQPAPAPGQDPRLGTTLGGRYYVRRLCGEGAMGRVYEGQHIDIGRRVAIKVLHVSYLHSPELVERFRREARAASKIGHPNIIDVTDSGTTPDGAFYFVMEYLDGINLEQLIERDGPLPVARALLVAAQITRALEAAHTVEVIHRDLKPANIMLVNRKDEEDFVKVLDFGISKDLDIASGQGRGALTRPDVAIGTPVYMSPEQAAGKPADALTDVYAVGGLLYEMLTGKPPCTGEDALEVLRRKASEDPQPIGWLRHDLPPDVEALVMRALSRLPRDRQQSMHEFKDELLAALALVGDSPAGPPPLDLRRPTGPRPAARAGSPAVATQRIRLRSRVMAAAMIGLATLGGVALLWRGRPGDQHPPAPVAARPDPPRPPAETAPPSPAPPTAALDRRSGLLARAPAASARLPLPVHREAKEQPKPPVFARVEPRGETAARVTQPPPNEPSPAGGQIAQVLSRGQSAFDRGDYPEAVRRGREAIAAGATITGRLLVGDAYYRLERYGDALHEYETALALDPNSAATRRRRDLAERAAANAKN